MIVLCLSSCVFIMLRMMIVQLVLCVAASRLLTLLQPVSTPPKVVTCRQLRQGVVVAALGGFEFPEDNEDDDEGSISGLVDEADNLKLTDRPAANLTVAELQGQLKLLGQRHTGTKAQLIERVQMMQRKAALGLPIHDMQVQRLDEMRWYMLQTANGFERAVERTLNMVIKSQRLEDKIERVFVPILEGETSIRESSVMPSYIFVRMAMDANLHFLISELQYVINFVGADRGARFDLAHGAYAGLPNERVILHVHVPQKDRCTNYISLVSPISPPFLFLTLLYALLPSLSLSLSLRWQPHRRPFDERPDGR